MYTASIRAPRGRRVSRAGARSSRAGARFRFRRAEPGSSRCRQRWHPRESPKVRGSRPSWGETAPSRATPVPPRAIRSANGANCCRRSDAASTAPSGAHSSARRAIAGSQKKSSGSAPGPPRFPLTAALVDTAPVQQRQQVQVAHRRQPGCGDERAQRRLDLLEPALVPSVRGSSPRHEHALTVPFRRWAALAAARPTSRGRSPSLVAILRT